MSSFIANQIIKARKLGLAEGQAKYRAYFVNTHLYLSQKPDVDTILDTDGYGDCIVSQ